ncbi:MAG: hypothetical protein AABX88_01490, partial [Nanoarchaeota archaeon]
MAEKRGYKINDIYEGGYSTLSPTYSGLEPNYGVNFTGYQMPSTGISQSTDARTANVMKEISEALSAGMKNIEMTQVDAGTFESIPQQHLKELHRLSKLTGVEISVHAPVIEPSGATQQGFNESDRMAVERQMNMAVERSHEINPEGNIPVTFHSTAGLPGTEKTKDGKIQKLLIVNQETGEMGAIKDEPRYIPGHDLEKQEEFNLDVELRTKNNNQWIDSISQLIYYKDGADKMLQANFPQIQHVIKEIQGKQLHRENLTPTQQQALSQLNNAHGYLSQVRKQLNSLFHTAYKFGTEEQKNKLKEISENFGKNMGEGIDVMQTSHALQGLMNNLQDTSLAPQIFKPLNEFAREKSTETFSNIALNAYSKFGKTAPIISIENPPAGTAFSTGEELRDLVEISREKFVEKAMKDKKEGGLNMSKSEAKKQAEKLLGVTWDVGHINMLRKRGYESEDIIQQTKAVAPLVKHVHLSDNFGFEHTELP